MAVDLFLKLDGIKGESLDDKHKDEIVLESFSWGETNAGAHVLASGAGAGKISVQDFHFTAAVSKASPKLMLACATGQHIASGVMTARQSASEERGGFEFLFFKFFNILVSSVQIAGDTNQRPLDAVSLAFQKVNVEYKEQSASGQIGAVVDFGWDLKANKKI